MIEESSTLSVTFDGSVSYNPNTSKSTDILFMQLALGEGPIYRVAPNGPQDIEIDDRYIDDLVDFETNKAKPSLFAYDSRPGTIAQSPQISFFPEISNPVRFSSPVLLKSGINTDDNAYGVSQQSVLFFPTNESDSFTPIDSIRFKFKINSLETRGTTGSSPAQSTIITLIHPRYEVSDINNYLVAGGSIVNGVISGGMSYETELKIPDELKDTQGYAISASKISPDVAEPGFVSEIEFIGFNEISKRALSYPRTALVSYALRSNEFRSSEQPNFTTLIKGLIVDVPSNYNQPILPSGEIDWRQIEVPPSGVYSSQVCGYRLQNSGSQLRTDANIPIYIGVWDGLYKKDWTENRVWMIKHLITDPINGLGIPERYIDKYNFYRAAQYCDAVNFKTGFFEGVLGYSDGTFRSKPLGYFTDIKDTLIGLPEGIEIKERRFTGGVSITDSSEVMDIITSIASSFRATISSSGNKIRLIFDQGGMLPSAFFNETNATDIKFSGVRESDQPTSVDVSFINLANHFRKETINLKVSDSIISRENKVSIDTLGCTKKSEALRLAKYHLDTSRKSRRKVSFKTSNEASDLEIGEIFSLSIKSGGFDYGYAGIIRQNTTIGTSNVYLEHITSPAISDFIFMANTLPLSLKVLKRNSAVIDYYIISNTNYQITQTGNTYAGADAITVNIIEKLNETQFVANTAFSAVTAPSRYDMWAIGEINPSNVYSATSDKLFMVDSLEFIDNEVSILGSEYIPEVSILADNAAVFLAGSKSLDSSFTTPPPPILSLQSIPSITKEGLISYNILLGATSDTENFSTPVTTSLNYGYLENVVNIFRREA